MKEQDDWRLTEDVPHELGRGDPFAAAIRGTRMPMVITDPRKPDNPIVFVNAAFQKLTGYPRKEILGRNCRFLQGPDTDPAAVAAIGAAIRAVEDIQIDILNYRKDGSTFWNALFLSPVRGQGGELQFFFASQLDLSDRIRAHHEIADQKASVERLVSERTAELQAALEAKTLLLHEVDHRVKNNLTMIGALLRLQARSLPDPQLRKTLDAMLERVDALATVHRRLYQSDDITRFDVGALTETLTMDLLGSTGRTNIETVIDVRPGELRPSPSWPPPVAKGARSGSGPTPHGQTLRLRQDRRPSRRYIRLRRPGGWKRSVAPLDHRRRRVSPHWSAAR